MQEIQYTTDDIDAYLTEDVERGCYQRDINTKMMRMKARVFELMKLKILMTM